ncbi:hypothetical protein [Persephonella sp.]
MHIKIFLITLTLMFGLITFSYGADQKINDILNKFHIQKKNYVINGPIKMMYKNGYIKFFIYPKEYKIPVAEVKIMGKLPESGSFKGLLLVEKGSNTNIIIIPTGESKDEEENS